MLNEMERNTIKFMRKKGRTYNGIAQEIGCNRETVTRSLKEPADKKYHRKQRESHAEPYRELIKVWLQEGVTITRMLEKAREDTNTRYTGGKSAFYDFVVKVRKEVQLEDTGVAVRFEGMPGEYLQVDWGESRNFPFISGKEITRYFFAARLKHSRVMYVDFQDNMRLETLIRCMLRCFVYIGGVSWACVFDNMKTIVQGKQGKDERGEPIWNETFRKFSNELEFHRELCDKGAGNQKGSVENLVRYVKDNFISCREFLNDVDLAQQCQEWLRKINGTVSQAHREVPFNVLPRELEKFTPLLTTSQDYGLFLPCKVNRESIIHCEGNMYSVPTDYVGQTVIMRLSDKAVSIYNPDDTACIATHLRYRGKGKRVAELSHFEAVLKKKPKARVMMYRDFLVSQDNQLYQFISHLCHRRRSIAAFGPDILKMSDLFMRYGKDDFTAAVSIALEWEGYGAEYLEYLLEIPAKSRKNVQLPLPGIPLQKDVDRNLASYLVYAEGGKC